MESYAAEHLRVGVHPASDAVWRVGPGCPGPVAAEATWDALPGLLAAKYDGIATRIVLYNALADPEKVRRYGEVARQLPG